MREAALKKKNWSQKIHFRFGVQKMPRAVAGTALGSTNLLRPALALSRSRSRSRSRSLSLSLSLWWLHWSRKGKEGRQGEGKIGSKVKKGRTKKKKQYKGATEKQKKNAQGKRRTVRQLLTRASRDRERERKAWTEVVFSSSYL